MTLGIIVLIANTDIHTFIISQVLYQAWEYKDKQNEVSILKKPTDLWREGGNKQINSHNIL